MTDKHKAEPGPQTPASPQEDPLAAAVARIEAAAARSEAAAERAERAARAPIPAVNQDGTINTVVCGVCSHTGAPMPDGRCPNNNCPTRAW